MTNLFIRIIITFILTLVTVCLTSTIAPLDIIIIFLLFYLVVSDIGEIAYKQSIIGIIDEMISRDMKLSEIFDDDANWAKKQFGEYHSKVNTALTELKQKIEEL